MGCGTAFMRLILFVTNIVITIFSIALIVVGAVCIYKLHELETIFDDNARYLGFGSLAVGMLLLVLGITGVCGACVQGTKSCLIMHLILLALLIIGEAIGIGMLLYYSADDDLEKEISTTVQDAFKTYGGNETSSAAITDGIDMFQEILHCCGQHTYKDWGNSSVAFTWVVSLNYASYLPDSCCKTLETGCGKKLALINTDEAAIKEKFYVQGCEEEIHDYVDKWSGVVTGILIAIAVLQVVCFLFGVCLSCFKKD